MTDPYEDFIELMGLISQADGEPRIGGRMFGLLLVEGRALTLNDFARRLGVSKASASTNARRLADLGVIRQTTFPGERHDYYQLVPDLYRQMNRSLCERFECTAGQVEAAEARLPDERPEVKRRIRGLAACYRVAADTARELAVRLPDSD